MSQFFVSDIRTVLVLLFWANLTVLCLLVSYVFHLKDERNRKVLRQFTLARIAQTVAWCLFIVISPKPGMKAMLLGLAALFGGLYIETRTLFFLSVTPRRFVRRFVDSLAAAGVLGLLFSYVFLAKNDGRILLIGLLAFLVILLPGPISLLRVRLSPLQTAIGLGYGVLILVMIMGAAQLVFPGLPRFISPWLLSDLVKILFVEVTMIGGMGILLLTKQDADRRIVELAFRDPLTGLHNRRYFMEEARNTFRDALREKREMGMVFLDIDHFKEINDTFGHHFGDTVLRDFASVLRLNLRPLDRSCRYGGEEFLLLLPGAGREASAATVGRILELVRQSRFSAHPTFSYTVSAGIHVGVPGRDSVDELLRVIDCADTALYTAKGAGRDRFIFFENANAP